MFCSNTLVSSANHQPPFGAGTIGQIVPDIPSGLSLTSPQESIKKNHSEFLDLWASSIVPNSK
jgi:hypothetical protein